MNTLDCDRVGNPATKHRKGGRLVAVAALLLAVCLAASGEPVRYHGIQLDEHYKLMVEQRNNALYVFLSSRSRVPGGPLKQLTPEGKTKQTYRIEQKEVLLSVRVTILRPAPPNYLSNPGLSYRIIIQGVELEPDLVVIREVPDTEARKTIIAEFNKIGAREGGLYKKALHYAGPLVLGVLKASGFMPAEIPLTVKRSEVGRIRGLGTGLQRKSLPAGRDLNPLHGKNGPAGPEHAFTFPSTPEAPTHSSIPGVNGATVPGYSPRVPGAQGPLYSGGHNAGGR